MPAYLVLLRVEIARFTRQAPFRKPTDSSLLL